MTSDVSRDSAADALPFIVEARGINARRVLAKASSLLLARAIYDAACREHPDHDIVVKRGDAIVFERLKSEGLRSG